MSGDRVVLWILPGVVALFVPLCAPPIMRTRPDQPTPPSALWQEPVNLAHRDLFDGEWGAERSPQPDAVYTFLRPKEGGANPGMVVRGPDGREWNVKQPIHTTQGDEGPVEVVLSRVLAAVGYHQPAVYYLRTVTVKDATATHVVRGGRFRLRDPDLKERSSWSWQQNPFVGTRPLQGLLVILLIFRSSDLKNANNSIYEFRRGDVTEQWYVVRDLGAALGETGRWAPFRNDPDLFERQRFILGRHGEYLVLDYHGFHNELFRDRMTAADVGWACTLLDGLTSRQWADAFRAGGYEPAVADRFIRKLRATIAEGLEVARTNGRLTLERR